MKRYIIASFAIFFLLALPYSTKAQNQLKEEIKAPKIMVVKFYADWCGSCKIMKPAFDDFLKETLDKPVLYVHFDLTDEKTRQQSAYLAHSIGLSEVYKNHAPKTGYALLIEEQSKTVQKRLTKDMDTAAMLTALDNALK